MGGIPQETLLAFNHIPKKHSGSGSAGNWQRHNKFLFYKLVLIFAETMQVSWRYHSSIKVLTSCFSIATFSSGIITKSDFSTLGNSVAEEFLPASSLCVLEFLSGPLFSPFWTTTCHLQSSSFHCSPLFPRSLMTMLKAFISLQNPVEVQHLSLSPHCKGAVTHPLFLAFKQSMQARYVFQLWPSLLKNFE